MPGSTSGAEPAQSTTTSSREESRTRPARRAGKKSVLTAVLLVLLLGPFGVFYASTALALVFLVISAVLIWIGVATRADAGYVVVAMVLLWLAMAATAAVRVLLHNRGLE
jgi:hypothetical protein